LLKDYKMIFFYNSLIVWMVCASTFYFSSSIHCCLKLALMFLKNKNSKDELRKKSKESLETKEDKNENLLNETNWEDVSTKL